MNNQTSFKSLMEVLQYLQKQGYKIAKSKFYEDVKKGLLLVGSEGISPEAVAEYARTLRPIKGPLNEISLYELKLRASRLEVLKMETLVGEFKEFLEEKLTRLKKPPLSGDLMNSTVTDRAADYEAKITLKTGEVRELEQQIESTLGLGGDPLPLCKKQREAQATIEDMEKCLTILKKGNPCAGPCAVPH